MHLSECSAFFWCFMKKDENKSFRTKNFATVVYPESCPENWLEVLGELLIPCFVSPLHDKDFNPNGEPKKPHFHVLFRFDGVKTLEQVKEILPKIGGVGCEPVNSIRGYARYLCHLDNPEKAQYDTAKVRCFCGADYIDTVNLITDKYKVITEILDYCDQNKIYSYRNLVQYCRVNRPEWFRVLCDNGSYVVLEYLKSAQWTDQGLI